MKKDKEIYSAKELKLFKKIESGKQKSLPKKEFDKEKIRFQKIAANTLKRKSINIRVFESDIDKIKAIALSEGMPYQTLITSILHKVATGKISESILGFAAVKRRKVAG
jgi:predicted DNA binding CopG/RHH family protein